MLYLEDYLEMIEHLPGELRDRFTEMRETDLSVQNRVDSLENDQKVFFASCAKKLKAGDREEEYEKIRREYRKVVEESSEKIQIAEECYSLVDRYLRKLDQELHKFKMELEADNRGITEILEKHSLEMDAPPPTALKENRHPKKHSRKHHGHTTAHSGLMDHQVKSDRKHHQPYSLADTSLHMDSLSPGPSSSSLASSTTLAGGHTYPLQHMGAGGNAIAAAASQAIAATQQLTGRRTSSLKASFEAINLGVQTHEFSIGRELAGAAQSAIASTSLGGSFGASGSDSSSGGPSSHKRKKMRDQGPSTPQVLDVVSGTLIDDALLNPNLVGSPSADDILAGGSGGGATPDQEWNYDPSEPRYCMCNQVSYGDMVACDNEDCPYEWFHYPCVGISAPPKGKWYCPSCQASMARRKGRK